MTKTEFKEAMKRGLGRCVLELDATKNIEKYRKIILWGCRHNLSFDTQCEGTRALYMHELVNRFPDTTPFIDAVIKKFAHSGHKNDWGFSYYSELLSWFASDDNERAKSVLWEKYTELYTYLLNRKRCPKGKFFPERDNFQFLCVDLSNHSENRERTYLRIAEDMGKLYQKNKLYYSRDFDYFQSHNENELGKVKMKRLLTLGAKHSSAVALYISKKEAEKDEYERNDREYCENKPKTLVEFLNILMQNKPINILLGRKLIEKSTQEEVQMYAEALINETNIDLK